MADATNPWNGRRVLVTGCTGFLGGAVVRELLAGGAEVVGLVRDRAGGDEFTRHRLSGKVHIVRGRVEDLFRVHSALAIHEVGCVFHLASCDPNQPDRGTETVLEAVRRHDARVPVVMARPNSAMIPTATPVPLGVAVFGEVFGPGDRNAFRVVPAAANAILARGAVPSGGSARDFVFVRDAAAACLRLGEELTRRPVPRVELASFRSDWVLTGQQMAAVLRALTEDREPAAPPEPPANPFGWQPRTPFAAALVETLAWYRNSHRARPIESAPARRAA